jgi:hypothetical protein
MGLWVLASEHCAAPALAPVNLDLVTTNTDIKVWDPMPIRSAALARAEDRRTASEAGSTAPVRRTPGVGTPAPEKDSTTLSVRHEPTDTIEMFAREYDFAGGVLQAERGGPPLSVLGLGEGETAGL